MADESDNRINLTESRQVEQRAQYLARAHDLRQPVATALAWRERGYSHSGIASQMDTTTGTVGSYMNRIVAEFGLRAVESRVADERMGKLPEFSPEVVESSPPTIVREWLAIAENSRHAPEWIDQFTDDDVPVRNSRS